MEQQNLQDNTDIEIDVLELFHVLLNKFWIILLAGSFLQCRRYRGYTEAIFHESESLCYGS